MCHEQSQSGGASITFFSSVYQINISYTLRFVDVEFFISIPYMHSTNYCVWYPNNPRKCKSRHFSECVIGGWLTWNSSPAFLAPPDADWSRLSSSCANGACLSCKLWKWTPFAIGRTLSTDNMLPPISLCMKCINCHDNPDGHRCDFIYWTWRRGLDPLWPL